MPRPAIWSNILCNSFTHQHSIYLTAIHIYINKLNRSNFKYMYTYIYLHFFIPLYTQVQETHKEPFSTISSWMIVACDLLQLQSASVTILPNLNQPMCEMDNPYYLWRCQVILITKGQAWKFGSVWWKCFLWGGEKTSSSFRSCGAE